MDNMNAYLSFFEDHIKPLFRNDTNARIGETLIALAYPEIFLIGPPPFCPDVVVDVKKEGLHIEPDKYPLYRFLIENSDVCEKIIRDHESLMAYFKNWHDQR